MANDSALFFRILHASERAEKPLLRIDRDELDAEVGAECSLHLAALVKSEQSGVYEDAGELLTDCAVHERRGYRRIHAAGQSADHPRLPNSLSDTCDLFLDKSTSRPRRLGFADRE